MNTILWLALIAAVVAAGFFLLRSRSATAARSLDDEQASARRWVQRLGGQVYFSDAGAGEYALDPGNGDLGGANDF